jgi:stage II sporulation protein R
MKAKRVLAILFILSINLVIFLFWQSSTTRADEKGPIPRDAIRLRILANSDTPADQTVKRQVRDAVNSRISDWVGGLKTSGQAATVIRGHLPELRQTVARTLRRLHADSTFTIKLGKADFPTKMYGTYVYPAGQYQALVISLGAGRGANWWCVLFPPLCFLDFSNSEAVRPDSAQQPDAADTAVKPTRQEASDAAGAASTRPSIDQRVTTGQTRDAAPATRHTPVKSQVQVHFFVVDFFTSMWRSVAK